MTAEQLEELLRAANTDKWVRGFNDYGNPVARLNYGGIYGTAGDGFNEELDLLMLAPSLARRVIAAEKLVDDLEKVPLGDGPLAQLVIAYREASK